MRSSACWGVMLVYTAGIFIGLCGPDAVRVDLTLGVIVGAILVMAGGVLIARAVDRA